MVERNDISLYSVATKLPTFCSVRGGKALRDFRTEGLTYPHEYSDASYCCELRSNSYSSSYMTLLSLYALDLFLEATCQNTGGALLGRLNAIHD